MLGGGLNGPFPFLLPDQVCYINTGGYAGACDCCAERNCEYGCWEAREDGDESIDDFAYEEYGSSGGSYDEVGE